MNVVTETTIAGIVGHCTDGHARRDARPPDLVILLAIAIAVVAHIAVAGFAVTGLRSGRRGRERMRAAPAAGAAVALAGTTVPVRVGTSRRSIRRGGFVAPGSPASIPPS